MEGASTLLAGSFTKGFLSVPTSCWRATGQDTSRTSHSSKFCSYSGSLKKVFERRASELWIRSNGGARQILPNMFACLESLDSDNGLLNLQNHFAATYGHFAIQEARLEHELKGAAWLRAEAYSEQQVYTRYVDSFKKKFAEQEFTALKRRIPGQPGSYVCLVAFIVPTYMKTLPWKTGVIITVSKILPKDAVDLTWQDGGKETRVLGTLDVSLHHPSPGEAFGGQGLPYGYIANVCVDKSSRKQGIASTLMDCAVQVGRNWGLNAIYVHTHATNNSAYKLYLKKGFEVLQSGSPQNLVDGNLLLRLQI